MKDHKWKDIDEKRAECTECGHRAVHYDGEFGKQYYYRHREGGCHNEVV